jgi:hypothetical protein
MAHDINKICAGAYLSEAIRRSKSSLAHQRRFSNWLLNTAIKRTQIAIAQHIQSKRPAGQMEMFA